MSEHPKAARNALAARLKDLRLDAGLAGRQLAGLSGIHNTKISRIEHAQMSPSEADVRAWAIACGAARQIPELIAVRREVEQMWIEHRRALRAGLRHVQAEGNIYERTRLLRAYESNRLPGILQTPGYVHAVMVAVARVHDLPDGEDVKGAAQARLARQKLVTAGTGVNRYSFVIEESAMDLAMGGPAVMQEQLDFLLTVTRLPHVAFGIIPPGCARDIWAGEGFYIFDDKLVRSEMWTAELQTTQPDEIATFARFFELLRKAAVYGDAARRQIEHARERSAN